MGGSGDEGIERNIEYSALPSQKKFHESGARFKGFSGPIGSGKSQALCQEALKLSYVNPGRTGLLGAPTYPMLRLEGRLRDPKAARLCGFAVWTPKGYDWVYERFVSARVEGYETVMAKPFENRFLLDRIPDYYERLKHSYDGRFYEQEVMGEYLAMSGGRAYYAFDRMENVSEMEADPSLPLMWALDFNVDPMCSVVAQANHERVNVLEEIVLSRSSTYDACEEFARRFREHEAGLVVYADASGARLQTTGTTDVEILKNFLREGPYGTARFRIPRSNPAVRDRVMLMNSKLESAAGERNLRVHPRCKELIKDFEQVTYKENSMLIDKDRDPRRTHLSDALGYLVWQECRGGPTAGEQGNRLV